MSKKLCCRSGMIEMGVVYFHQTRINECHKSSFSFSSLNKFKVSYRQHIGVENGVFGFCIALYGHVISHHVYGGSKLQTIWVCWTVKENLWFQKQNWKKLEKISFYHNLWPFYGHNLKVTFPTCSSCMGMSMEVWVGRSVQEIK